MAAILQTTFSYAFSCMKILHIFFYISLFARVTAKLTISPTVLRQRLGSSQAPSQ